MRIEGRHRFAAPPERVWQRLQDPQTLADTLPGVRRLQATGPDEYAISLTVGVGAVKGGFDGSFAVADKREPESCTLRGSARGSAGSAQAEVRVRLAGDDGGTVLDYQGDAKVAGPIAGVGQRMLAAAARQNTARFLEAMDRALLAPAEAPAGTTPARAGGAGAQGPVGVYTRRRSTEPAAVELRWYAAGLLTGAALVLAGVAAGRWAGRR
jgi:carbon monoxide dehydrogenase subunit G